MRCRVLALAAALLLCGPMGAQSLTIYTELDPPNQVLGPSGKPEGMAVEVVQEIQRRVGNSDPITLVPWARGYLELQTHPHVVLFSTARTAERNAMFKWVGPINERRYFLYVKTGSKIVLHTLEDARKLRAIGVYKDDVRDLYLTAKGFTNLDRTIDNLNNIKKLMAGRVDAVVFSSVGLEDLARMAGCDSRDLKESLPLFSVQLYIAMSKDVPDATVAHWSQALRAMRRDRTFERIFRQYYPNLRLPGPELTKFE